MKKPGSSNNDEPAFLFPHSYDLLIHLNQEILVERVVKFVEAYYSLESKKKSHSSCK
jgi:hypothetical protein